MKRKYVSVPNALSLSRIVFLPLLVVLAIYEWRVTFTVLFIIIGSTDAFDGFIARRFNQVTDIGKALDSFADLIFYLACAWFLHRLYPAAIEPNMVLLYVFLGLLAFSFVISYVRLGKPILMHTFLFKLNAVLIYALIILSFFIPTAWLVASILIIYLVGLAEEIAIFIVFGEVDPDTPSILSLIRRKTA